MIINGKHVVYNYATHLDDLMHASMMRWRKRLIESATRSNAFVAWAFGREKQQRMQYQDGTINADLIHDWLPEERIYRG